MEYIEHLLPKLSKQVLAEKVECQVSGGIQKAKKYQNWYSHYCCCLLTVTPKLQIWVCDIVLTFVVMFVRFMTWYHVLSDCIGQESFVLPIWSWLVWLNLKLSKWGPLFTRTIEILAYFIWNLIHIKYIQGVQKNKELLLVIVAVTPIF